MTDALDRSVYPDVVPPATLVTDGDRADYLARICGAWDFGVVPTWDTINAFAQWRDVFDRFPLPTSPAYAALRSLFRWPRVPGSILLADYEVLDRAEGRADPSEPYW